MVLGVHTRFTESASQRGKTLLVLIGLCPSLVDLPQMDVGDGLESETPRFCLTIKYSPGHSARPNAINVRLNPSKGHHPHN